MRNFKKGDVVEALESSYGSGSFNKGNTYVVRDDHSGKEDESVLVEMDDRGSVTNGWAPKFFKLVKAVDEPVSAVEGQVGGDHYTRMKIQPITYVLENDIPFPEGNIIKYVSRWRNKGGVEDLKKAKHMLQVLIDYEESKARV